MDNSGPALHLNSLDNSGPALKLSFGNEDTPEFLSEPKEDHKEHAKTTKKFSKKDVKAVENVLKLMQTSKDPKVQKQYSILIEAKSEAKAAETQRDMAIADAKYYTA
jgi:hypothetical protein